MTARESRFELVRGDAGWFARYISANGKEVWRTSETYTRRRGAENAVESLTGRFITHRGDAAEVVWHTNRHTLLAEVRYVDERAVAS